MKHHIAVKFTVLFLCALALLGILTCGGSLVELSSMGISESYTIEDAYRSEMQGYCNWAAISIAKRYASQKLGGCPQTFIDDYFGSNPYGSSFRTNRVYYTIADEDGNVLESTKPQNTALRAFTVEVPPTQYIYLLAQTNVAVQPGTEQADALENANTFCVQGENGKVTIYRYLRRESPPYRVTVYLAENAAVSDQLWHALKLAWNNRRIIIVGLGVSLLLFSASAVFLCCVAGRKPDSPDISPDGPNRLPVEIYFCISAAVISLTVMLLSKAGGDLLNRDVQVALACILYAGFVACLAFVGLCYCVAAQVKTPGGYLWHNSLLGRGWSGLRRVVRWLWKKLPQIVLRTLAAGGIMVKWILLQIKKPLGRLRKFVNRWLSLLPLMWQWMLAAGLMALAVVIPLVLQWEPVFWAAVVLCVAIVIYSGWAFGTLLENARQMRSGDLSSKIDSSLMVGGFRMFAEELNGLAEVAMVAAENQLRSERMKSELITNVSHDIKTPLTSIINYVDLLERPHTPEEEKQYLEVLRRQSGRMKKLIDDLMEMSKAASGSIAVEIIEMQAQEAVNQVLGEFGDKLEKANLTPVFHHPEEPILMQADGRLLWRAMSNVLSNAVKYALPGTRLYVELTASAEEVQISLRNISRDQLTVSPEELLERFVRGDVARNTEGSGLGLNIAKSLMELQGGALRLAVDGDLFKVILVFRRAGTGRS